MSQPKKAISKSRHHKKVFTPLSIPIIIAFSSTTFTIVGFKSSFLFVPLLHSLLFVIFYLLHRKQNHSSNMTKMCFFISGKSRYYLMNIKNKIEWGWHNLLLNDRISKVVLRSYVSNPCNKFGNKNKINAFVSSTSIFSSRKEIVCESVDNADPWIAIQVRHCYDM